MPPPRHRLNEKTSRGFFDREQEQSIFEKKVGNIPETRSSINVFYGPGGEGKTALCRHLYAKTCLSGSDAYAFLRSAILDLHGKPLNDVDKFLVLLRNELANSGVNFSCFDLALAIYWETARQEEIFPTLTKAWLCRASELGKETSDDIASLAKHFISGLLEPRVIGELLGEIPGAGYLLKKIAHWSISEGRKAWLHSRRTELQALYNGQVIKPNHELAALLPWMLAQDLNHHILLHRNDRHLILIDEYEALFDEAGAGSRFKQHPIDKAMQALGGEANGLLITFFSRERLAWDDIDDWKTDLAGQQHLLGGLPRLSAQEYIDSVPIADAQVAEAILQAARESNQQPEAYYPLLLDLSADHWLGMIDSGKEPSADDFLLESSSYSGRCRELVSRILRGYGSPLEATLGRLSILRRFDQTCFDYVVTTFGTALPLNRFKELAKLSFITETDDGFLALHNVISNALETTLSPQDRDLTIRAMLKYFENNSQFTLNARPTEEQLTALSEASYLRYKQGATGYAAWIAEAAPDIFMANSSPAIIQLWENAVSRLEVSFGAWHPDLADALDRLGTVLRAQGDLQGSVRAYERSLLIREKLWGRWHPAIAESLNNLAGLQRTNGRLREARKLYERALEIIRRRGGFEPLSLPRCLDNLGGVLQELDQLPESLALHEQSYALFKAKLGFFHKSVGISLMNLGSIFKALGRYRQAEQPYKRALTIHRRLFGVTSTEFAKCLLGYGGLESEQGRFLSAAKIWQCALEIVISNVGHTHLLAATCFNLVGNAFRQTGELEQARQYLESSLVAQEETLGSDHYITSATMNNLALVYKDLCRFEDALTLMERSLRVVENLSGRSSFDYAVSENNIGQLLLEMGQLRRARMHILHSLVVTETLRGEWDMDTATCYNSYGLLLESEGEFEASIKVFLLAAKIKLSVAGDLHFEVAHSLGNAGRVLHSLGHWADAIEMVQTALHIYEEKFGSSGLRTTACRSKLAELYMKAGDLTAARWLFDPQSVEAKVSSKDNARRVMQRLSLMPIQDRRALMLPSYDQAPP